MYEFLVIGPLGTLLLILVYHSLKTYGRSETLKFFLIGLLFGFFREIIIGSTFTVYVGTLAFELGPFLIAPGIILGWVFPFYIGHYFVQKVTENTPVENHILVKVCLGSSVVLGFSLIMETTGPLLEWWTWKAGLLASLPEGSLFFGAPIFAFIGWTITGAAFFTIYYLLQEYNYNLKAIISSIIIYTIIMVNFVVGNYFILYNPAIEFQIFYESLFQFSLLILLAIYIKKRHPQSLYENLLLFLFCIFYTINSILAILRFLLNPIDPTAQVIFSIFSLICVIIIVIQIPRTYSIINKLL